LFVNDCHNFSNGITNGAPPVRRMEHVGCNAENCAECEQFRRYNIQLLGQTYRYQMERVSEDWTTSAEIYVDRVFSSLPCNHCSLCVVCQFAEGLKIFCSSYERLPSKRSGLDTRHFCSRPNCRHCEKVMEFDLEHLGFNYGGRRRY
jgi:hypothetical protein